MLPGFTLIEVMAALLLMAIIIPVALQGMSSVSRAAQLGQKKLEALQIAEKVMAEQFMTVSEGQPLQDSADGTETQGDQTYNWTMKTEPWSTDAMTVMTVTVKYTFKGALYDLSTSTLYDPGAAVAGTAATTGGISTRTP